MLSRENTLGYSCLGKSENPYNALVSSSFFPLKYTLFRPDFPVLNSVRWGHGGFWRGVVECGEIAEPKPKIERMNRRGRMCEGGPFTVPGLL